MKDTEYRPGLNWMPLEDPDKPDLPYLPGLQLIIRRHVPLPPFGLHYTEEAPARSEDNLWERSQTKLTDWALRNPPSNTSPPHPDASMHGLEVLEAIACKDGRGAQLVRCHLDENPNSICVAKIYDPFYYSYLSPYSGPLDVTWKADYDFSHEAAAYEVLSDEKVDGQLVPKYYGSWTFDLPVPVELRTTSGSTSPTRPVRMILMESVPGVSIDTLLEDERKYKSIPVALRLAILAKAMETVCRLEHHGVRHNDFAPRNVIVSHTDMDSWETQLPAVRLIDFGVAHVTRSPYYKPNQYLTPPLPPNPRYRFYGNSMLDFGKWLPDRLKNMWAINGWLRSMWRENEDGFENPPPIEKELYDDIKYIKEYVPIEDESPVREPSYR